MELEEKRLEDLSAIQVRFFTARLKQSERLALIVQFAGVCGIGCKCHDDCYFMMAMIRAGMCAFRTTALILDLTELEYVWGDEMEQVLRSAGAIHPSPFFPNEQIVQTPSAVIISDRCREGLTSLVEKEMGEHLNNWLFESRDTAVAHVDAGCINLPTFGHRLS